MERPGSRQYPLIGLCGLILAVFFTACGPKVDCETTYCACEYGYHPDTSRTIDLESIQNLDVILGGRTGQSLNGRPSYSFVDTDGRMGIINRLESRVYFFSPESGVLLDTLELKSAGRVVRPEGLEQLNDSLWVVFSKSNYSELPPNLYGKRLHLFDDEGNWIRVLNTEYLEAKIKTKSAQPNEQYYISVDAESPMIFKDGMLYLAFNKSYPNDKTFPVVGRLNPFDPADCEVLPINYPQCYLDADSTVIPHIRYMTVQLAKGPENLLISYPGVPIAFNYAYATGKVDTFFTFSRFLDLNQPATISRDDPATFNELEMRHGRYGQFVYSEEKDVFVRIIHHPHRGENVRNRKYYRDKTATLLLYDRELNFLGESSKKYRGWDDRNICFDKNGKIIILNVSLTKDDESLQAGLLRYDVYKIALHES